MIEIQLTAGPLPAASTLPEVAGAGAVIRFEGVVRGSEDGRPIVALDYEVYEAMVTRSLRELAEKVIQEFGLLAMWIEHSHGRVGVGECSFRLTVGSRHRAEGLAGMGAFIDRMKQDVPIWKSAVFAEGTA